MALSQTARAPTVAGLFYPADADALQEMVDGFLVEAQAGLRASLPVPKAIVAPHAGYVYSGALAPGHMPAWRRGQARLPGSCWWARRTASPSTAWRCRASRLRRPARAGTARHGRAGGLARRGGGRRTGRGAHRGTCPRSPSSLPATGAGPRLPAGAGPRRPGLGGDGGSGPGGGLGWGGNGGRGQLRPQPFSRRHQRQGAGCGHPAGDRDPRPRADHPPGRLRRRPPARPAARGAAARPAGDDDRHLHVRRYGGATPPGGRLWRLGPDGAGGDAAERRSAGDGARLRGTLDPPRPRQGCGFEGPPRHLGPELEAIRGSFITLTGAEERLRGCIGTIQPRVPLIRDVVDNAFKSAFRDPRFKPLTRAEFAGLTLSISSSARRVRCASTTRLISSPSCVPASTA